MKKFLLFRPIGVTRKFCYLAMALIASVALPSCSDDNPEQPEDNPPEQETVTPEAEVNGTMTETCLMGFVTDADGNALADVSVKSGTHSVVTNEAGAFKISKVDVNDGRSIVQFSKSGYFSVTRAARFAEEEVWNVTLVKKGSASFTASKSFESSTAAALSADGMKVALSANGLKNRSTGEAYTGKVVADMLYLSPNNKHFSDMMPGSDMSAVRTDGTNVSLVSYGMTAVNLTDEAGEPLQLADGTPATLTFPIPEGMEENPRETIPLWSFNESTGKWVEEGVAQLENGVYVGTVTHFSWVNLDWPEEQATVSVTVKNEDGTPIAQQRVKVGQLNVRTDQAGQFSQEVPAGESFDILVRSEWYGNYSPEVRVNVPALSPRQNYQTELILPRIYKVSGRLLENGKPAVAYLWVSHNGKEGEKVVTGNDGRFSIQLPVDYTGDAVLNILSGTKLTQNITIGKADIELGDIELGGSGDVETGALSPTEAKEYLESVATDFLGLFNPDDQAELIEFANYFVNTYGDLDEPEEWGLDDEDDSPSPYFSAKKVMRNLRKAVSGADPSALTRAFDDCYDFSRFSGVYEPGSSAWLKTGESNDIVFKFKNGRGQQCTVSASGSGGEWSVSYDGSEVRTPENVTVTVVEGSTTYARATVRSNVSESGHSASISIDATAANIGVVTTIDGTDTKIAMKSVFTVSGKEVVTTTASVGGSDLCNRDKWERIIDDEDTDAAYRNLGKAVAEIDLLNRLQIKAEVSDFESIDSAVDNEYGDWDYDDKSAAKAACSADCDVLNAKIIANVYYSSPERQAEIWFQPELDEDMYYWEWYVTPCLRFISDGTTYSFEDYFGNSRFASVENQWDVLYNGYKNLWR